MQQHGKHRKFATLQSNTSTEHYLPRRLTANKLLPTDAALTHSGDWTWRRAQGGPSRNARGVAARLGAAALAGHLGVHNVGRRVAVGVADALPQRAHAAPCLAADLREHLRPGKGTGSSQLLEPSKRADLPKTMSAYAPRIRQAQLDKGPCAADSKAKYGELAPVHQEWGSPVTGSLC